MTEKYTHLGAEVFADDEWSGQGEFVVAGILQGEDWKMIPRRAELCLWCARVSQGCSTLGGKTLC